MNPLCKFKYRALLGRNEKILYLGNAIILGNTIIYCMDLIIEIKQEKLQKCNDEIVKSFKNTDFNVYVKKLMYLLKWLQQLYFDEIPKYFFYRLTLNQAGCIYSYSVYPVFKRKTYLGEGQFLITLASIITHLRNFHIPIISDSFTNVYTYIFKINIYCLLIANVFLCKLQNSFKISHSNM